MRTHTVHNFFNACEQILYSIMTEGPLSESEVQLVEYYCKEIFLQVASRMPHRVEGSILSAEGSME